MTEFEREKQHLFEIRQFLHEKISGNVDDSRASKAEIVGFRRYMWEDTEHDALSSNQKLELQRQEEAYLQKTSERNRLRKLYNAPFFARIDFREDGEPAPEKVYIGRFGLMDDDTLDFLVYDWRSPVASMFYDAEYGRAGYDCPAGRIEGDISLKRQFVIEKGELSGMFDTSVEVQDEILQHILSRNTDEKMKDIVTTIQREQNRAIRDTESEVLVIEGCAGSGKTSVALHRIAYLLYRSRKTLSAENILLFSPNDLFSGYISDVLPSLGEHSVPAATFGEFAAKMIAMPQQGYYDFIEALLQGSIDPARAQAARRKGARDFTHFLEERHAKLDTDGPAYTAIEHLGAPVMTARELSEAYRSYSGRLTVLERLKKVRTDFFARVRGLRAPRIEQLKLELIEKNGENYYLSKRELAVEARLLWYREFRTMEDAYNAQNMPDAFSFYLASAGEFFGEEEAERIRQGNGNGELHYEDVAPLLYAGCLLGDIRPLDAVRHVVVDEAQDYSFLQYRIFSRLFRYARFTILGDASQTLSGVFARENLGDILSAFPGRRTGMLQLNTCYRSTREIGAYAAGVLGRAAGGFVDRHGEPPEEFFAKTPSETAAFVRQWMQSSQTGHSTAVITKTKEQAQALYSLLRDIPGIRLIASEYEQFSGGVLVLPCYLSKGLEFDNVVVDNTAEMDSRLLYVCCTRALHRLAVIKPKQAAVDDRKKEALQ